MDTSGGAGGEGGDASATPDTGPLTARGRSRLAGLTEALGEEGEGAPPPAALEELKALDGNVARSVTNVRGGGEGERVWEDGAPDVRGGDEMRDEGTRLHRGL